MNKWTTEPLDFRIVIDEQRQVICDVRGDSPAEARELAFLIAAAPEMADCLKKCERLAWEIGCETVDGVNTLLEDERGDLWREISGILSRIRGEA